LGTNFFTVVDCVRLQVVANVRHYEKGGDGAQIFAPAVLLLEIPERQIVGTKEQKSRAPAVRVQVREGGEGGGGGGAPGPVFCQTAPPPP
jgi:hypothetical protein